MESNGLGELHWTDSNGRTWRTRLDVPTAEHLKACGFDFVDHEAFAEEISDPYKALDFATELHRQQFEQLGLSEVDFIEIATEVEGRLDEVLDACVAGSVDFLVRRLDRVRAKLIYKAWIGSQQASHAASKKLGSNKVDEAIEAELKRAGMQVDRELDRMISGDGSESSPVNTAGNSAG